MTLPNSNSYLPCLIRGKLAVSEQVLLVILDQVNCTSSMMYSCISLYLIECYSFLLTNSWVVSVDCFCLKKIMFLATSLQNNLHDLWSLLNFLFPEIFSSAETFDEWFQISGQSDQQEVVQQLHKVNLICMFGNLLFPWFVQERQCLLKSILGSSSIPTTEA